MSDPREAIQRLRQEAETLPQGAVKVSLLEQAIGQADQLQDVGLGYQLRKQLMDAAFHNHPDLMLVAFAWCLAQYDRDPRRFAQDDLLWEYRWIIIQVADFPEIDRPRLEQLSADMERRYVEAGASLHAVYQYRRMLMETMGDRPAARAAHAAMRECRRDARSDEPTDIAHHDLMYYVFLGQWRNALRAAQPILDGRIGPDQLPWTLAEVLFPLLRLGRIDEARAHQRRGYRLVSRESHFVLSQAHHLRFVVLTGDLAQAKRLVERHLAGALDYMLLNERFAFLLAARLWTDSLLQRSTKRIKVRLPPGPPPPDAQGKSEVRQLGQWFTEQAHAIARRFDARNGNDYFQRQLDELPALLRRAVE